MLSPLRRCWLASHVVEIVQTGEPFLHKECPGASPKCLRDWGRFMRTRDRATRREQAVTRRHSSDSQQGCAGSRVSAVRQRVTVTVMFSYVNNDPSLATARSTYIP